MSLQSTAVSSLIKMSESIVGVIDRAVSFEESQLAKVSSKQGESDGAVTGGVVPDRAKRVMGTDIDHDAGSVDWKAVESTGTQWVYCKVNGGFSNTNWDFVDSGFSNYWSELKRENIARGPYCFFDLNADGQQQAELFLQLIQTAGGLEANDLPPCLDVEWSPSPSDTPFPTSKEWQDEALAWLTYVEEKTGRLPIIYTGLSMAKNHFDSRFSKYPLWVARYPTEDKIVPTLNPYPSYAPDDLGPWAHWMIWQYSESGTISGIGSGQDLDILDTSIEDFVKSTTLGGDGGAQKQSSRTAKQADRSKVSTNQTNHSEGSGGSHSAETKSHMDTVGDVSVYKTAPVLAVIYQGGLAIDADGSPFAYHPEPNSDKGLDYLADAGSPGNWWGIATENGQSSGTPVVQGENDPAPGYYVSTTSLIDPSYSSSDPRAYVNASEIPFIVLPQGHSYFGGAIGDIGAVVNFSNGKVAYVIAADVGPSNKLGEGSVALAEALGVNSSARSGGCNSGIGYCFFPGSGSGRPKTLEEINELGHNLFTEFGGASCLKKLLNEN